MQKELKPKKKKSFFPFKIDKNNLQSTVNELQDLSFYLTSHKKEISGLAVSSDKKRMISWSSFEGLLLVWEIEKSSIIRSVYKAAGIFSVSLTLNDDFFAFRTGENNFFIYSFKNFREFFKLKLSSEVKFILPALNNELILIDLMGGVLCFDIQLKKMRSKKYKVSEDIMSYGYMEPSCADLDSRRGLLAIGTIYGLIYVSKLYKHTKFIKYSQIGCRMLAIKIHPSKSWLVGSTGNSSLHVYMFTKDELIPLYYTKINGFALSLFAFEEFSCYVNENKLVKWKYTIGSSEIYYENDVKISYFYSNFELFGISSHNKLKLVKISNSSIVFKDNFHSNDISCIIPYENHKKYLITGSKDCSIKIWDYDQKSCSMTLTASGPISSISIRNPKFLVSAINYLNILVFNSPIN